MPDGASDDQAAWAGDALLRGFWIATNETPEWIAARTDALLQALGTTCGIPEWVTYKGVNHVPPGTVFGGVRLPEPRHRL